MKNNYKYIPESIFVTWSSYIESSSVTSGDKKIIYGLLEHSYNLLGQNCDDFQKVDIISNLRRIITKRISTLFNIYKIDKFKFKKLGKDKKIEKLEELGIVKPLLLDELFEIRNRVEYSNKKPPSYYVLNKLVDTVWYFIRSTDIFVSNIPDMILFENHNGRHYLEIEYEFKNQWVFKLRGWIPRNKIYSASKANTIKINISDMHNKNKSRNPKDHKKMLLTDYHIKSTLELEGSQKIKFIKNYFSVIYQ